MYLAVTHTNGEIVVYSDVDPKAVRPLYQQPLYQQQMQSLYREQQQQDKYVSMSPPTSPTPSLSSITSSSSSQSLISSQSLASRPTSAERSPGSQHPDVRQPIPIHPNVQHQQTVRQPILKSHQSSKHSLTPPVTVIGFDDLVISTSTNIIYFKNEITNLWTLFSLLPVRLEGKHVFDRSGRRKEFPDDMTEGWIYSLGYKGCTRGYVKSNKQFRHSLNAAMSTRVNIPTIKLSKNNIHICGLKDHVSIFTLTKRMIGHVNAIYSNLAYFRENLEDTKRAINWFNHSCRGKETTYEEVDKYGVKCTVLDHEIVHPTGYPQSLSFLACLYITRILNTYTHMGKAMDVINECILGIERVEDEYGVPIRDDKGVITTEVVPVPDKIIVNHDYVRCVLINYNFNIFRVLGIENRIFDMYILAYNIDQLSMRGKTQFSAIYDPLINSSVKLYLMVEDEMGWYTHTITLKATGSIIYTSGHKETSREVFNLFVELIRSLIHTCTIDMSSMSDVTKKWYKL